MFQHYTALFQLSSRKLLFFSAYLLSCVLLTGSWSPSFLQDNLKLFFKCESYSDWHFNKIECDFNTRGFFGVMTIFVASGGSQKTLWLGERNYYIKFSPSTSYIKINLRSNDHIFTYLSIYLYIQTFQAEEVGFEMEIWQDIILYLENFYFSSVQTNIFKKHKCTQTHKVTGENTC